MKLVAEAGCHGRPDILSVVRLVGRCSQRNVQEEVEGTVAWGAGPERQGVGREMQRRTREGT